MFSNDLEIGCDYYANLLYLYEDAVKEINRPALNATIGPPYAIFPKNYYQEIKNLDKTKKLDYCFMGDLRTSDERKEWVINFVKKYFTDNSIFINTGADHTWEKLGIFDLTGQNLGFAVRNNQDTQSRETQYRIVKENLFYFTTMCNSKFTLCPRGDCPWSFRFYEAIMCESIPIVKSWHYTYRTRQESRINYKYILSEDTHIYDEDILLHNNKIFKKYHLLSDNFIYYNTLLHYHSLKHPELIDNYSFMEGYMSEIPEYINILEDIFSKESINNVLQIGFNAGHSAELILNNNDNIKLISFDIGIKESVKIGEYYINNKFPFRHHLIIGDSYDAIPEYITYNVNKIFDAILIDGSKDYYVIMQDIINCKNLSNKDTILILNDTIENEELLEPWNIGSTNAYKKLINNNYIIKLSNKDFCKGRGFTLCKYNFA